MFSFLKTALLFVAILLFIGIFLPPKEATDSSELIWIPSAEEIDVVLTHTGTGEEKIALPVQEENPIPIEEVPAKENPIVVQVPSIPLITEMPEAIISKQVENVLETPKVQKELAFTLDEINLKTREALVNIICTTIRGGSFKPLSGSGVMIDDRGVILTNAHVAEYFLLKDYLVPDFIDCVIRTGEPARNAYKAELLYLSPLWIESNYKKINEDSPSGTGEHDFALLRITESTNPKATLPEKFPALGMEIRDTLLRAPQDAVVAAYPAGFLGGVTIQRDLYPASSIVQTGKIFSFDGKTIDTFSIGGSPVAQHGSSGGAVVNAEGNLLGLIVTSTEAETTGERDLHAITVGHISRSFKEDTGRDLFEMLSYNLQLTADSFNEEVAPALTKLLEGAISGGN